MELKLKVLSGKQAGVEIAIAGPKFTIGRGDDNHLRPHSDAISRHHCEVLVEGGTAVIRDLGSRNGTYVNGQRIQEQQRLKAGDKLTIGQLQFEVHLVPELGGPKRPKVLGTQDAAKRLKSTPAPAAHDADVARGLDGAAGDAGFVALPLFRPEHRAAFALDEVWSVQVDPETAVHRLVELRGFKEEDARARLATQISNDERERIVDRVLWNEGSLDELFAQLDTALELVGLAHG